MPPVSPPEVLVLAVETDAARRWGTALRDAAARVWLSAEELPRGTRPDVIVTDLPADEVARRTGITTESPSGAEVGIAVVAIGTGGWADVVLDADCTDRELCLACRLVAEIARLRSQRDESDRIRHEATKLAQTDPLTGLPNRRAWEQRLAARLPRAGRRQWLAIVDLDCFKQVNDRLGMAKGDEVLARAAQALAGQLRREDMLARLGGDEFGLLLWDLGQEHVERVLGRLRAAVAEQATPEGIAKITASIGYVAAEDQSPGSEELFAAADRAMRRAKQAGGDQALRG